MENLELYEKYRKVPEEAKKGITGGRLNGMTDINPMWRIKSLTEAFGPCGIGWKPEIVRAWLEPTMATDEVAAFVQINLYINVDGKWSESISAVGGSKLIAIEKGKPYCNDECYKMAYTDAMSVACKMLGMGADVYWNKDVTKYTMPDPEPVKAEKVKNRATDSEVAILNGYCNKLGGDKANELKIEVLNKAGYKKVNGAYPPLTKDIYAKAIKILMEKENEIKNSK